jgi:hypothetical protein
MLRQNSSNSSKRNGALDQQRTVTLTFHPDDEFDALIGPDGEPQELADLAAMYRAVGFAVPDALPTWEQPGSRALGLYLPGSDAMSLRAGELTIEQQATVVHELVHALTDQHHALDRFTPTEDAAFACRALVEGDASVVENRWFRSVVSTNNVAEPPDATDYQPLPEPMESDAVAPYVLGSMFVELLLAQGGWDAVDDAYSHPPASSAELMQPERFLNQDPLVPLAATRTQDTIWAGSFGMSTIFLTLGQQTLTRSSVAATQSV